jgi:antitoxin component YwqK of YwqJK toxin-antitoxin module
LGIHLIFQKVTNNFINIKFFVKNVDSVDHTNAGFYPLKSSFLLSLTDHIVTMRIRISSILVIALALFILPLEAQTDTLFNQTDANNLKQGWWKKTYPNGKMMYKGFFKDNKPAGLMYRYYESGALKAILNYDVRGEYARARLMYEDGQLAAEGVFFKSLKDGNWSYYSYYDKSLTAMESYLKGERHGMMINYYSNGDVSEKLEWKNNRKEGIWEQYYQGGILKMKAFYVDDKLDGDFLVNYASGSPNLKGRYEKDLRQGKWTFFKEDGTIEAELDYQNGKVLNEDRLTEKQQELFRTIDANEGKFEEPDESDFIIPPGK